MIARVKIAPLEHWCERAKKDLELWPASIAIVGKMIEIIPSSMLVDIRLMNSVEDLPGTKFWRVSDKTHDETVEQIGEDRGCYVCEHMLEMD